MASNPNEAPADGFLDQILGLPHFAHTDTGLAGSDGGLAGAPMFLHLNSADGAGHLGRIGGGGGGAFHGQVFPLGLSLEQGKGGFLKQEEASGSGKRFREGVVDGRTASVKNVFHGQPMAGAVAAAAAHPPAMRPRVRARRGQATDPHSIAERLRRERIAERIRGLQELVPSVNKTDRAAMLDEIVDYVKFLRLQVKVSLTLLPVFSHISYSYFCFTEYCVAAHVYGISLLLVLQGIRVMNVIPFKEMKRNKWPFSFEELIYVIIEQVLTMSRLGGAAAVAPFVIDIPLSSIEDERGESGRSQPAWEKWSNDGTERHVAKLMEENVGAAMQFLQSKALCIMPTSLAKAIYHTQPPDTSSFIVKPETDPTS
ncbi:hypothetical protein Gogos_017161 [Gossypium gossypioides]|uniref:BHLH domain-containing protein n=1 Tax=Gossypium gossypioides TaxID=34282 RepID=A0A7J9B9U6_GOSGO|nr:hypothetical protein [Gossypium gossypioides]